MSQSPTESQPAAAPAAFTTPGTLIAVAVWVCLFATFIVLGLQP